MSLLAAKRIHPITAKVNGYTTLLPLQRLSSKNEAASVDHGDEYQYIEKSKVGTMHFQRSMPRLPIPQLEKTCERYLLAQKPILIEEQLRHTESCVKRFLVGEGPTLQKELKAFDAKNRHTSYISEYWFDMYLRDRKPLPINYNPIVAFAPEKDPRYENQLIKATNLLISSIRFMKSLRTGVLAPEVFHLNPKKSDTDTFRKVTGALPPLLSWYGAYLFKAFPLDMSQYHNLFNTTRIPELEKDMIYQDVTARHIVVMRKGNFYRFDVLDKENFIYSPKEIASNLKAILADDAEVAENPIGLLTTTERDLWAGTRHHLSEIGNQDLLKTIDSAILMLILDEETLATDYKHLIRTLLHSDGVNRWFDKSFSLIVAKDGTAGLNFEHSWGDGVAILRYLQDVKKDTEVKPRFHPEDVASVSPNSSIKKLNVVTDARISNAINQAKEEYKKWYDRVGVDYFIYDGFGKKECKTIGVSPDAVMQLAFQLAYYKQEREMVATYESCSTAAFKHGRTETVRSCTTATRAFCEAVTNSSSKISKSELKKMIVNCCNTHNQLIKEAAMEHHFRSRI
ncbi:carnitine O-palmitoyltransferase 2, mitochondrial-like isoform X2 [Athalia rosae]|uniref:carnitine O-palmitoyltransferase 2, mitochondrial-like isoform X2 n=1 Tax=Athalia rosae TaxID=37344 RepID=UPI002033ED09|nr:carnitine O-palmitoyltransferase 2, mitochondrial-like isoform X2 [Athalia rosae]